MAVRKEKQTIVPRLQRQQARNTQPQGTTTFTDIGPLFSTSRLQGHGVMSRVESLAIPCKHRLYGLLHTLKGSIQVYQRNDLDIRNGSKGELGHYSLGTSFCLLSPHQIHVGQYTIHFLHCTGIEHHEMRGTEWPREYKRSPFTCGDGLPLTFCPQLPDATWHRAGRSDKKLPFA